MKSQDERNAIKTPIILNNSFSQKNISNISIKNKKDKKKRSPSFNHNKKEKTKIIWSEGGNKIYLTGNFCQWNELYLMKKDNKDEFFYYILDLPKGFHQFKFKVDGKWKISSIYPQYNVNKKVNNYLDNSYITYDNISLSTRESSLLSTMNNNNVNNINNIININNYIKTDFSYSKKNYCNYYPKKNEMKDYTDKKPNHFQTECYHGINQLQNIIGNKKFLYLVDDSIFCGNDSYKDIEKKDHVLLNHYCNRQIKKDTFISSVSIRYRHKNVTFLYYRMQNNC
jgi:hypothetical protein